MKLRNLLAMFNFINFPSDEQFSYDVRQVFDITLRPMLENWMRECKFNVQIATTAISRSALVAAMQKWKFSLVFISNGHNLNFTPRCSLDLPLSLFLCKNSARAKRDGKPGCKLLSFFVSEQILKHERPRVQRFLSFVFSRVRASV
jgi:hypothetical protein